MQTDKVQTKYQSKIGSLYLVASPKGMVGVYWHKQTFKLSSKLHSDHVAENHLIQAIQQLGEYFEGRRTTFTVPLDLQGTDFQKSVWKQLTKIPYGATVSYSQIAKQIKKPAAVRAVGAANGKNPLCVLIPCHRVIGSNGSLTGFSGGLEIKKKLLEFESYEK